MAGAWGDVGDPVGDVFCVGDIGEGVFVGEGDAEVTSSSSMVICVPPVYVSLFVHTPLDTLKQPVHVAELAIHAEEGL